MSCSEEGCKKKVLLDGKCMYHVKQDCSICLEPVKSTNTISTKRLHCGHAFHQDCILEWFVKSDTCPNCKDCCKKDPFVVFKEKCLDELRLKYSDVLKTANDDRIELLMYPTQDRRESYHVIICFTKDVFTNGKPTEESRVPRADTVLQNQSTNLQLLLRIQEQVRLLQNKEIRMYFQYFLRDFRWTDLLAQQNFL